MMTLPTVKELLDAAQAYNRAITPLPILIYIPTLFIFVLLRRSTRQDTSRGVLLLAAEWGIVGVLFFITYVGQLHPLGYVLGGMFVAGGVYYAGAASRPFPPHFFWTRDLQTWLSLLIALLGIFGYPALSWAFGRNFPASLGYGLTPSSVAMLTLAVLLSARPAPRLSITVPALLWAATGFASILIWGLWEDVLLIIGGLIALVSTLMWRHKLEGAPVKDTRFDF